MKATASFSLPYRALAVLLAVLMVPLPVLSQPQGGSSSSKATQEAGQISALIPAGFRNASAARVKDDLYWNDVLKTDKSGRMRVNLRDGSILSLGSDTEMKVVQHDAASQQTQLELDYGKLRSRVVAITKPGGKFQVKTPKAVAGVVGTDFGLVVNPDGSVTLYVYSGTVTLTLADGTVVTINAGQTFTINSDGSTSGPKPTPPDQQQQSILDTNVILGGTGESAGNNNLLRNILIGLGVIGIGLAVGLSTSGGSHGTLPPSPTPPPTPIEDGGTTRPQ
ncbi:MAG TPA: FecR family protein [Terriglobales bacterium]|nr:FecR family protein [Terriglobales bacterium]